MPRAKDKRTAKQHLRQARNKVRRVMEKFLESPETNRRDRVQNAMGNFLHYYEEVKRDGYTRLPCAAHGINRCCECR